MNNSPIHYSRQIDGLRFFAVMGVMICHFVHFDHPFMQRLPFGHGVVLFFVISGYLITRILLQNKEAISRGEGNPKKVLSSFYMRRSLRIFPIYYLTIFFMLAVSFPPIKQVWPYLVSYTTNYFIFDPVKLSFGSFMHFWSLAVEEQFYLAWPFLMLLLPKKHVERFIIGVIAFSIVFKVIFFLVQGWTATLNSHTMGCADALGLGALLAYWSIYRPGLVERISSVPWVVALSIIPYAFFIVYPRPSDFIIIVGNNFLYSIFAFFLMVKASGERFRGAAKFLVENRAVVHLGRISYGIYVYHLFMPDLYNQLNIWFPTVFDLWSPFRLWFHILAAIGFAELSWYLIERPILRLKKRIPYTGASVSKDTVDEIKLAGAR